jgi:hypothetical protein
MDQSSTQPTKSGKTAAQRLPLALWVFCVVIGLPTLNAPNFAARQDTLAERAGLVVMVWAMLGLEALVLHAIVRPYAPRCGWMRVLPCLAGAGLLLLGLNQMQTYDVAPSFAYAIGLFPILAALALVVIGFHRGIASVLRRWPLRTRTEPPDPRRTAGTGSSSTSHPW